MKCKKSFILLFFAFLLINVFFVSASQNFLDKKVSYEYGKFTPQIREDKELNNYFKKLEISEEEVYVFSSNIFEVTDNNLNAGDLIKNGC